MDLDPQSVAKHHREHFSGVSLQAFSWEHARFVVLDTETTGLDVRRDRLISIGAVGIFRREIELQDSFEIMMPIAFNTSSVTVHGITKEEAEEAGVPEEQALAYFLDYLRDGIIVGHHIGHDIEMLSSACERHFGFRLENESVDTMDLYLRLEDAGAFRSMPKLENFSLDGLCRHFHTVPHDRHTAAGDAFITAQIFIRLLHKAWSADFLTVGDLTARYEAEDGER